VPYKFEPAVDDPNNWINHYIEHAKKCTDAPWDYHEAHAIFLLSLASQGLKLTLQSMPGGMRGNLYLIFYGVSSKMRKSTAMSIARDVLERAFGGCRLPENFTPGGLEEAIAERAAQPQGLDVDEFHGVLDKMHHQTYMAGTRSFLLTLYAEEDWDYIRRARGKQKDNVSIRESHLCIAGNVTPAISNRLKDVDIEDGFMARFGVIMPTTKPPRRRLIDLHKNDDGERTQVAAGLREIRCRCDKLNGVKGNATISMDGLRLLDAYQEELENKQPDHQDTTAIMLERIADMAIKLSMLIALGRDDGFAKRCLKITEPDVRCALAMARKWSQWSIKFARSLHSSDTDRQIDMIIRWLRDKGGEMTRTMVSQRSSLGKRILDDIQSTMIDRGTIKIKEAKVGNSHKPTMFWVLNEEPEEDNVVPLIREALDKKEVTDE